MLSFPKQPFPDLPYKFLIVSLFLYIGSELLTTVLLTYLIGSQLSEQTVILCLRFSQLIGFIFLIHKYQVVSSLGLSKPNRNALNIFLIISSVCVFIVGIIYITSSHIFAYIALPIWLSGVLGLLLMVVLAPIVEEIVFRGLLYRMLRERWGVIISVAVSALFFSLVHHGLLISPQLLGGIIFALAYEWSRSLWVAIALHMGANAAVYIMSVLDLAA